MGFFTSPLVTQASDALDSVAPGAQVSVARRGHYCHAVEARLSDLRVAQGRGARLPDRLQICDANEVLSDSVPNDQVVRGSTALHQPRDVTSMVSVAFEGMCSVSAAQVVDDHSRAALDPGDPATALELINTHVLGFPPGTEQHQRTGAMLGRSFRALTASPPCASTDDFRAALAATEPTCGWFERRRRAARRVDDGVSVALLTGVDRGRWNRRDVLRWGAAAGVGLGIRAALTGLPISFLVSGRGKLLRAVNASRSASRVGVSRSMSAVRCV